MDRGIGWRACALTEYVAKRYAGRIRRGGILLSVHCDSREWCDRAKKTLKDTGARNISSASEAAADYGTTDKPTERAPAGARGSSRSACRTDGGTRYSRDQEIGGRSHDCIRRTLEKQTLENTYFRRVLFTGKHAQLVVMCLGPGEEIGDEVHQNVDQFFRIEQGEAKFVFNERARAHGAGRRCGGGSGGHLP